MRWNKKPPKLNLAPLKVTAQEGIPEREQEQSRQPATIAIVATTGTGKSTLAEKLAKMLSKKVLIVTNNFEPIIWNKYKRVKLDDKKALSKSNFIKVCRLADRDKKEAFKLIHDNFKNGLIIWDDCKIYLDNALDGARMQYFKQTVINHRHRGLDHIFIGHQPEDVPPRLWAFIKVAYVGVTTTKLKRNNFKANEVDKFFQALEAAREEMKAKAAAGKENPQTGIFKAVLLSYF